MSKDMHKISVKYVRGWGKVRGLIGKKIVPISFMTRYGIHTFGVDEPIDVLILNKNSQAVVIKQNLKPNRIFLWNPFYVHVIELPKGTVQRKKIYKGDTIMLSPLA